MDRPLFIGLIHSTKDILDDVRDLVRRSLPQFSEKESEGSFYKKINSNIENIDTLLDCFLNYIKATTPIGRKEVMDSLVEEILEKHQHRLKEKNIRIFKRLEKELPESIVPHEQMMFIVDSVVQYAISSMPFGGDLDFSTKSSFSTPKPIVEDYSRLRSIEITVIFTYYQKSGQQLGKESQSRLPHREAGMDLLLRLVYAMVKENKGTMDYKADETTMKGHIVLKFPSERRKAVHYQPIDD